MGARTVLSIAEGAKAAQRELARAGGAKRSEALTAISAALRAHVETILEANRQETAAARENSFPIRWRINSLQKNVPMRKLKARPKASLKKLFIPSAISCDVMSHTRTSPRTTKSPSTKSSASRKNPIWYTKGMKRGCCS